MRIEEITIKIQKNEIKEQLFSGEIELKSSWKQENGKKISALSNRLDQNTKWLLIGIDDDGKVLQNNSKWLKETEKQISDHLNLYLDPVITCTKIHSIDKDDQRYIALELNNPSAVVYWNGKAYKGAGSSINEMDPPEVLELSLRFPNSYDFSSLENQTEINENLFNIFSKNCEQKNQYDFFSNFSSKSISDRLDLLKIKNRHSANILFGSVTARLAIFEKENVIQIIKKGLYEILQSDFLKEIKEILDKRGDYYPDKALKEALTNAVAHASYNQDDGEIVIEIHPEKITISNLCYPEFTFFANKWFSRNHKSPNKLLMEILRLSGLSDELGRGKNLIYSESIKSGKKPPEIFIEKVGRFNRWSLNLYTKQLDQKYLKVQDEIKELYSDNLIKQQIAYALVLSCGKPLSTIRKYFDQESVQTISEIIKDFNGPIYYWEERDLITPRRWISVILESGKKTKKLSSYEEEDLYKSLSDYCNKYQNGIITNKELREFAKLGNSKAAYTQSSLLLKQWVREKRIKKIKQGAYEIIKQRNVKDAFDLFLKEITEQQID
ncbi:RNA-binding domain-containing protein [Leptospira bourretii]|uniref:Schlafen AlbA-2 domain-containing protein n=1 Tax=Leptospira bourretii TaxID=2484962 RepID=A0ABY2LJE8_9LEPT|nr:RNA-binding domain-containing protein [Leptospira bourretii]TGK92224.1 hypothetical protein EHQ26_09615 [Leptospira bourretii]TGL26313.1 hypothetical protein EHQ45_20120 [Leptospira bourretii]